MESENKDLNQSGEQNVQDPVHHSSLVEKIAEKLLDVVENMDTDFPLSGGEEHPVHRHNEPKKEEHEHIKTSFREDLETDFPLSGGEVDH